MTARGDANSETAFKNTGSVEQDRPEQKTNVAPMKAQLDHRNQDPYNKQSDAGQAEQGQTPEFSGESTGEDELNQDTNSETPAKAERELKPDDFRTKKKDDDLAA